MANSTLIRHKSFRTLELTLGLAATLMFLHREAAAIQAPVVLGSTAPFGVLAATTVTSTGATTVKTTVARNIVATITAGAVTAGKFRVVLFYR